MQLIEAFRDKQPTHLAFVGAGGKTSALFRVARELTTPPKSSRSYKTILVTTTTHFGAWQARLADQLVWIKSVAEVDELDQAMPEGILMLSGGEANDRLSGLKQEELENVRQVAERLHLPLLIEADGAHTRPLKAPDELEPVIPEFVQHVVVVAGLTGLGQPLSEKWVHRPKQFARLSGIDVGEMVTEQGLINVLRHEQGGLKNIPPGSRKSVLLNQADTAELQAQGQAIAEHLLSDYHSVIIASISDGGKKEETIKDPGTDNDNGIYAVVERVAGLVLAAGASTRFGEPKQLLMWKQQPLIRHVAQAGLAAGLSPMVVVLGASAAEVERAILDLPVRIVNNGSWMEGLSSSIKAGINSLPECMGGAVFFQADQPQVSPTLVRKLVEVHQGTLAPIVLPQIDGQRGNPVLFDRNTFVDLLNLKGEMGGRELFSQYPMQWVTWHDPKQLMDIDTQEDYQNFLESYPESEANP